MAINNIVKNVGAFVKIIPSETKWYALGLGLGSLATFLCWRGDVQQIRSDHKVYRKLEYYDAITKVNDMLRDSGTPYSLTVEFKENNDVILKLNKCMEADK